MKTIHRKKERFSSWLLRAWAHRDLAFTLARRDLKIQYAQTFLGVFSSLLQPLISLLIFWVFFSKLIRIDTGDIPYHFFVLSGLTAWYLFSYLISSCGTALLESQHLIRKVNFPRIILPFSKILSGLVHLAVSLFLLFVLMAFSLYGIHLKILLLPVFILLNIITGFSVAVWLSALTIRYRDVQHIIPYLLSFGIWLTPVFYPGSIIPEKYFHLMYYNPMAGVIEAYRWCLLSGPAPAPSYLLGFIPVLLLLVSGLAYFRKIEKKIPDFI